MRHLRRRTGPVAAAAAVALTLAACGGGETAADRTPAATGTEQAPTQGEATTGRDAATGGDAPAGDAPTGDAPTQDGPTEDPTQEETTDGLRAGEGSGDPYADIKAAADHVGDDSATALATGLVEAGAVGGDVSSPAVKAYVQLSRLLQEHVYLAGFAVDAAYSFGADSQEFDLAAGTLDQNSVALAELVGSVAPDQQDAFLRLWREHVGFFVDYAVAAAGGQEAAEQQALEALAGYRQQSSAFFEQITGGAVSAGAVADELAEHVELTTAAIDALAADDPSAFERLKDAADQLGESGAAGVLAGGIARGAGLEGDIGTSAAGALATLTTLLEEHVYLTGLGVKAAYATGADSATTEAALSALDLNTQDLAGAVGSVAPDQQEAFASLWRVHIGFFVDYAVAVRTGDRERADQALRNLAGYGRQAGGFFEQISAGAIPSSAVQDSLSEHVRTTTAAIRSLDGAVPQG